MTSSFFGKSPIKWRQHPDMSLADDGDVEHQFTQNLQYTSTYFTSKVQVGNDQEKAQSEKIFPLQKRGGKN